MRRERVAPRDDWVARLEAIDFTAWKHADGRPYWREDACFVLSASEVEMLHEAAEAAVILVNAAVSRAFEEDRLSLLGIDGVLAKAARYAWARHSPSLYGRFDFAWDGCAPPKLLEYNADTPTSLFEAAVVQWRWLIDRDPQADQYNSIHEELIAAWANLKPAIGEHAHFACMKDDADDHLTTAYMQDVAAQAGFNTCLLDIAEIGWTGDRFVDNAEAAIAALFKLYPWEWMADEAFGGLLSTSEVTVIEPAWRCAASSKALLADLWEMNQGHPILLPAFREPGRIVGEMVGKTIFGREGAGVRRHPRGAAVTKSGLVYQQAIEISQYDGLYPVFGVWVVGGAPCGLGIREDVNPITGPGARFIPHRIA